MSINGKYGNGSIVNINNLLLTILILLGGAMTYLYLQDRTDWLQFRRQYELDMKLMEVRQENMNIQMQAADADRLRLWQKYDQLRDAK